MLNIWEKAKENAAKRKRAFTVLAPMEDVTDTVFRQLVLSQGRPDIFMTEFTNCDGLASRGRPHIIHRLEFSPIEHPIVAQIWGRNIETYIKAVPLIADLGFDGIDINMGCPVEKVIKSGAGSGLINYPEVAEQIITEIKNAIQKSSNPKMALSVKTRIGFSQIKLEWVEHILKQPIDAATFHLRTTAEMSKVPAHWEILSEIVKIRDSINKNIVLVANGDITTKEELSTFGEVYGVDGLMVGRGIFNDITIFNSENSTPLTKEERIQLVIDHIKLFQSTWDKRKNFQMIKKYFKIYLKEFEGAAELRNELLRIKTSEEMLIKLSV